MNASGGRKRTAAVVLTAAVAGLALAPTAHAQGITNPAAHPYPITVTIDGQTYSDGRDTLPGYDDVACTAIPYVSYDFGQNSIIYKDADGQLLDTATWTEWSRISSYDQWVKEQKTPTPTPTATATPTSQATATPTAGGGGGGGTTTPTNTTTTNNTAATNQTSTTTKTPTTKTQTTKKNSSTTTQTSKNSTTTKNPSSNKTQTTKTTTKSPSTTSPSSTATSTPSSSSSSSSKSTPSATATATADSGTDAAPAAVTPGSDPALETSQPGGVVTTVDSGNGTSVPADNTVVAGNNVPTGTPGAANAPVAAGAADTSQYKLASQSVDNVGDTRVAGIGILVALVVLGVFCLIFGQARQQLFGRR